MSTSETHFIRVIWDAEGVHEGIGALKFANLIQESRFEIEEVSEGALDLVVEVGQRDLQFQNALDLVVLLSHFEVLDNDDSQ
jgi:hypothetical protein